MKTLLEMGGGRLETDKRNAEFSIRVPERVKVMIDRMSKIERSKLNNMILETIAFAVHVSRFDSSVYLSSHFEGRRAGDQGKQS